MKTHWSDWKQAFDNSRLGDAESPRRAFFRRCYPGALQIVVVSDNFWKLHLRTATLEESALKSRAGRSQGTFQIFWKNADDMWKYSLLKTEWHGLTGVQVGRISVFWFPVFENKWNSERTGLEKMRMGLSFTIHIHHTCKVTWQS